MKGKLVLMCKAGEYPFNDPKVPTVVETDSQLSDSELDILYEQLILAEAEAESFPAPAKGLKTMPWKESYGNSFGEPEPVMEPAPQQPQLESMLDAELLRVLQSELEANPEAQSLPEFDAKLKAHLQKQFYKTLGDEETKKQIAEEKEPWRCLLNRRRNFYNKSEWGPFDDSQIPHEVRLYFSELQYLVESIEVDIQKLRGIGAKKLLRMILSRVYSFMVDSNAKRFCGDGSDYGLFSKGTDAYNDAFDVCFFMSLCMFLYETTRIKGMSLREFTYKHSPRKYRVKGTANFFDYDSKRREFLESSDGKSGKSTLILSEESKLRQYRKRLLDKRPVYHHSPEWAAIRKVSEHEWELYFRLEETDDEVRDTEKRIRNLYNDIYSVLKSKKDEKYIEKLDNAREKFRSKLKKIQYGRFLNLGKLFLAHIGQDESCYGLNLYRFEKEMKLYRITHDVNRFLNCDDEVGTKRIINQAACMENIIFPKLYDYFCTFPDIRETQVYAETFWTFMDDVVKSSLLVIDKFIEDGVFGGGWEQLILETTNELAGSVLYDPSEIDYSTTPNSQQKFLNYLLEHVDCLLNNEKNRFSNPCYCED